MLKFCERVIAGFEYKDELKEYLREKMDSVAPNLTAFIGESVRNLFIYHL